MLSSLAQKKKKRKNKSAKNKNIVREKPVEMLEKNHDFQFLSGDAGVTEDSKLLSKLGAVILTRDTLKMLFFYKKYEEIDKLFSRVCIDNMSGRAKDLFHIMFEIFFIIKNQPNEGDHQLTFIMDRLDLLDISNRKIVYGDIMDFLFKTFFSHKAYQKVVDYSIKFIEYMTKKKWEKLLFGHADREFFCSLYKTQGQAYHKLLNPMLAREAIQKALVMHQEEENNVTTPHVNLMLHNQDTRDSKNVEEESVERINIKLYLETGDKYKEIGDPNNALKAYDEAIQRAGKEKFDDLYFFSLLHRGLLYFEKKEWFDIERAFLDFKAVFLDPSFHDSLIKGKLINAEKPDQLIKRIKIGFINIINTMRLPEESFVLIRYIETGLDLFKHLDDKDCLAAFHLCLFAAHYSRAHYPQALSAINYCILQSPKEPGIYVHRAKLYADMDCLPEAKKDLKKVADLGKTIYVEEAKKIEITILIKEVGKIQAQEIQLSQNKESKVSYQQKPENLEKPKKNKPDEEPARKKSFDKEEERKKQKELEKQKELKKQEALKVIKEKRRIKSQYRKEKQAQADKNTMHEQEVRLKKMKEDADKRAVEEKSESIKIIQQEKSIAVTQKPENPLVILSPISPIQQHESPISHFSIEDLNRQMRLRKKIMEDVEFKRFSVLACELLAIPVTLRMVGSGIIMYFLAMTNRPLFSLFNKDIDIQVPNVTIDRFKEITNILIRNKFSYENGAMGYTQLTSDKEKKNNRWIDFTLITNQEKYDAASYDPIKITHCGLFVRKNKNGNIIFKFDKNIEILNSAFLNGYLDIDLSGEIANATCLFLRIIKYSKRFYSHSLKPRFIFPNGHKIVMNDQWDHPLWIEWLKNYFQITKSAVYYKEINELIKGFDPDGVSYFYCLESLSVLLVFCQKVLNVKDEKSFASLNMVSLLRYFYDYYSSSLGSVDSLKLESVVFLMINAINKAPWLLEKNITMHELGLLSYHISVDLFKSSSTSLSASPYAFYKPKQADIKPQSPKGNVSAGDPLPATGIGCRVSNGPKLRIS